VEPLPAGYVETGYASWYGDPYHGRRAANGEVYDKNKLTAAHLTMPFETWVKVTNIENQRSVTLRITDRGPFVKGRIIDVSEEAARQLQMIAAGVALVRLEVLDAKDGQGAEGNGATASISAASYAVQIGSFRDRDVAERLRERLQARYGRVFVERYDGSDGVFHRVRVGPADTLPQARNLASQLERENLPGFIVRLTN
jgi:rare lipoprotein A